MSKAMSAKEFVEKAMLDGGVFEALKKGLEARDMDPDDSDGLKLREVWTRLEDAWATFEPLIYDAAELALRIREND